MPQDQRHGAIFKNCVSSAALGRSSAISGSAEIGAPSEGSLRAPPIAQPGEVMGLSATVSGNPYELSAETMDVCQVNFVKRDDLLRFLKVHVEGCFKVAEELSTRVRNLAGGTIHT